MVAEKNKMLLRHSEESWLWEKRGKELSRLSPRILASPGHISMFF